MKYKATIRKQFTFNVSDKLLACLLTENIRIKLCSISVNVVGFMATKINDENINLVKIIVGPTDINYCLTDNKAYKINKKQNKQFRINLRHFKISYTEQYVIQLFNIELTTDVPGFFRIPYTALVCSNIPIIATYFGQPIKGEVLSTFYEIPKKNIFYALAVIKSIDRKNPDENLCINKFDDNC